MRGLDLRVGLTLHAKIGDRVRAGTPVATVHYDDEQSLEAVLKTLPAAFETSAEPLFEAFGTVGKKATLVTWLASF